jgi:two-component system nitrogen regulation response regulator GlnG
VPRGVGVRDLGSSNGSFVLGNRIVEAVLPYGAHVRIGNSTIELLPLTAAQHQDRYGGLIGHSESMRHLFALLQRLEASDVTVLIIAETGTGKELVAHAIHEHGRRRNAPFVVFDCASVPRELVESELFGHVKGAFTGAVADREGVFEQAHGGTLFLDEIGELSAETQTRLLRVLESNEVKRVGANNYRTVDVRIVAATHRDLRDCVQRGTFRADLYYRLAIVPMTIPPLRERTDDIPVLAQHFATSFGAPHALPPETLAGFAEQEWPGNVRELRNAVHRATVLGDRATAPAAAESPPAASALATTTYKEAKERLIDDFELRYVRELYAKHEGNIAAAAREAGLSRRHLYELLRKHGLLTA